MSDLFNDPVQDISFGQALQVSLNNYYDLLKTHVGGLGADEFLQLKLVADPVDINGDDVSKRGYPWWSFFNLLLRSDRAISPKPINDQVEISAKTLVEVYGDFLSVLEEFVVYRNFTQDEQTEYSNLTMEIVGLREQNEKLYADDQRRWHRYADIMGYSYGDSAHYLAWESHNGNLSDIAANNKLIGRDTFQKARLFKRHYPDPEDKKIVDAVEKFNDPVMKMGYPIYADYRYSDGSKFSPEYLATINDGNTNFESHRVRGWNMDLDKIRTTAAGHFIGNWDKRTEKSESITKDWNYSGEFSYSFINVTTAGHNHTEIQEDFNKGTKIRLSAAAAFRLNIHYPEWFVPSLFDCQHVIDNPKSFNVFFGPLGKLLYYPTALILVRGFAVKFESSQSWTYDYKNHFSADMGGGFSFCGFNFGDDKTYTEDTKQHEVDQQNTTLEFADDDNTIRFVGYAVAKNTIYQRRLTDAIKGAIGEDVYNAYRHPGRG